LHARTRVCVPLSQLVLQSVHCVHVLQPPCPAEETGGEERGKLTFHFAAMCQVAYYNNKVSGTPSSPCLPTITQIAGSNSLGQLCVLQGCDSSFSPMHGSPPYCSGIFSLVLNFSPPPHSLLHSPQLVQGNQIQLTEEEVPLNFFHQGVSVIK